MTDTPQRSIDGRNNPIGTWLSVGHPTVSEAVAQTDLDFVLIDTEHTTMSLETVENMARSVDAAPGDTQTVVRVPWNDPVTLKRVIDIGVGGVMVPMLESAEEAEQFVDAVQYPPDGSRGIAGSRATNYGTNFEEYVTNANGSIFTIAQIETERGLENATDIAAVDGIHSLFVGPSDLSGALDVFGHSDPDSLNQAIDRIVTAGHDNDTAVGTLTIDSESVERRLEQGFDFLIVGKDTSQLIVAARESIDTYERALDNRIAPESED